MESTYKDDASERVSEQAKREIVNRGLTGYAPLTRGLNSVVRPFFRGERRSPPVALLLLHTILSRNLEKRREGGENEENKDRALDLSSISDRVKQTLVGSHLYRDNGCNFGSALLPGPIVSCILPPPSSLSVLLHFTYA